MDMMRIVILLRTVVLFNALAAACMIPIQAQSPGADAAAAESSVRAFHEALKAGDSSEVMRLLAPDAVILEEGGRESRNEYRDHHLYADIQFSKAIPAHRSAILIEVRGDVAWVSSTSLMRGIFQNRPINLSGAELMVLSRTQAGWVIRAIHWSSRKTK